MTADMWMVLAILAAAIVLFITEWLRVDVVALGVVVALMVTGLLSSSQAIAGFSNPVVLIVASLFVVGGAVLQTGVAEMIGHRMLRIAGPSELRLIAVIMLFSGLMSGFISNTGTVAVLLPAVVSAARATNISPSRLLMPLAYASLLGGATTLIGTTPNIIASDLLRAQGEEAFSFFDFTPIGITLLIAGVLFMLTVGRRLLPDHKAPPSYEERVQSPRELIAEYRLPDNLYRLRVPESSNLCCQSVGAAKLRETFGITVIEIIRGVEPQPLVRLGDQRLVLQSDASASIVPTAETALAANDLLIVQGEEKAVRDAVAYWGLVMQPVSAADQAALVTREAGIAEVLLPPRSTLVGKTLVQARFGTTYKLTVLNIIRPGDGRQSDIKDTPLQFGDTLLVQGYWRDILALRKQPHNFVVMGRPESMLGAPYRHKAPVTLLIVALMLIALTIGIADVATISMVAALAMVLSGCLTMDDAYASIDWKSIVLIAGMLPMSTAMQEVGLVSLAAEQLTASLGDLGPLVLLASLFLLTALFTQVLSNTATSVLIAPVAFATAQALDVHPQAFLMAVAIAASMAFATPVASPPNTLVMGAGSYRFRDYLRTGLPMIAVTLLVSTLLLPVLWPF